MAAAHKREGWMMDTAVMILAGTFAVGAILGYGLRSLKSYLRRRRFRT